MFKVGDVVIIKELDVLVENGDLKKAGDLGDVYCNRDKKFVVFPDFNYYGTECTVDEVDTKDADIPYFLSVGIWVPEFMIEIKEAAKEPAVGVDMDLIVNADQIKFAADPNPAVEVEAAKVWINKFNNKPFGSLFVKLINIDPKVAEFSATSFSKLKKHELQYIAKILIDNGRKAVDYNKLTQKELSAYCYAETLAL